MKPLLSREQMRAYDTHAIQACQVPSMVLMENAGRNAAEIVDRELQRRTKRTARTRIRVGVVCGGGNNGGDGFVVARHLVMRGYQVVAWRVTPEDKMTVDCNHNYRAFQGIGGSVIPLVGPDSGGIEQRLAEAFGDVDILVDALFGTGLDRPITGVLEKVVDCINGLQAKGVLTVALDLPSGMDANTGAALGTCVHADVTVAFGHRKLAHAVGKAAAYCGRVHVVDLGIPESLGLDAASCAHLVEAADVRACMKARSLDVHKYRAGHVAVFGGSRGKTGAAVLAGRGALRGGAGAVTVATWQDQTAVVAQPMPELMVASLAADCDATSEGALEVARDAAKRLFANKGALTIGPGFGTTTATAEVLRSVFEHYTKTVVLDADALTVLADSPALAAQIPDRVILTPHAGELSRLLRVSADAVESDRFGAAREAAQCMRSVVLLKGPFSIVASPDGRVVANCTGSPALATAGAGDVLAGLVAALAVALEPFEAAMCAAYLHGAAGDRWAEDGNGDRGMFASEIADRLPSAIQLVRSA